MQPEHLRMNEVLGNKYTHNTQCVGLYELNNNNNKRAGYELMALDNNR